MLLKTDRRPIPLPATDPFAILDIIDGSYVSTDDVRRPRMATET